MKIILRDIIIFSLLMLVSACAPTTPTPVLCTAADLVAPLIITGTGPSQSGVTDDLTPELPWWTSYDCEFDGFRVEVALDGEFAAPGVVIGTAGPDADSWTPVSNLQPASYYQWRVAAVVGAEIGSYMVPRTIITGPTCGEDQRWGVSLDSPAQGEVVTVNNPSLAWSYPDHACIPEQYRFTVQEQPAGTTAISGGGTPSTGFGTSLPFVDDCTRYTWWVQPVIGGAVSENYSPSYFVTNFTDSCPGAPCDETTLVAPVPVSPANGAAWAGTYPIVSWEYAYPACLGNILFHAQIARDEAFTSLRVHSDNISGGWLSFEPAAATLDDCTRYYWRVAAESDGTIGLYSETWSFTTDFTGTCPGSPCDVTALPAPIPLTPENGAVWSGSFPIVTWDYPHPACQAAILFHAEVARDAAFTDLVVHSENIPGQSDTFDPAAAALEDCTGYYWHVAATTANGEGPFSETFRFRTDFNGTCKRLARVPADAPCYGGPGSLYPLKVFLNAGEEVELLGRSDTNIWLTIDRPDGHGTCWVEKSRLTVSGDTSDLPVEFTPFLPTATTVVSLNCPQFTNMITCKVPCIWKNIGTTTAKWVCSNP